MRLPARALLLCLLALVGLSAPVATAATPTAAELARWEQRARNVTIYRDTWGIAHVYGKTDADAVFGFLYAQAEDDFPRIELNYLDASGRRAEVEGESEIYRDLRMKLFIDPAEMQRLYAASPAWLRALMDAFADGLNYYLHTHPHVQPRLLTRFEPWMALTFTEGSIGGDIESISLRELEAFYGPRPARTGRIDRPSPATWPTRSADSDRPQESQGSNGFAIAPKLTAAGHALLLINPHPTFYFRPEIHVASDEGLDAYGAVTWGQFFIYQGFNSRCGWMHTSDGGDVIDEYRIAVREKPGAPGEFVYRHGATDRPVTAKKITVPYRTAAGGRAERTFTAYFTHHGPIVRAVDGRWVAVKLFLDPIPALTQSYRRTKARSYAEFLEVMQLRTNTSNNTVYADADGNIAYFHGNFIPRRDPQFDYIGLVDGNDPRTDWQGKHEIADTIHFLNPPVGWLQNTNNWPFSAAGPDSPRPDRFPRYLWTAPENARGRNAVRVLTGRRDFTLDSLIAAGYDPYLIAFEQLLPPLFAAFDALPATDARRSRLAEPLAALRTWDRRSGTASVPTTLAVLWAQELGGPLIRAAKDRQIVIVDHILASTDAAARLAAFARTLDRLERDFGTWRTPWGEINRFQRLSGAIKPHFDDAQPSLPVGFGPADWGSLAAFGPTANQPATKRIYGNRGNSFVAAVEFGPRVRAKTILAGGVSNDPASPAFNNQAALYADGKFKDALYYRADVERAAVRRYRPGDTK